MPVRSPTHCPFAHSVLDYAAIRAGSEDLLGHVCHEALVQLPDGSEFRVQDSGFGIQGSYGNFTEVKRNGGFLDVDFSSCTVPTFCRSLDISDGGSGFGGEVRVTRRARFGL